MKNTVITALCMISLVSCEGIKSSPRQYQSEIEDVVKFYIATAAVMAYTYEEYEKEVEASWDLDESGLLGVLSSTLFENRWNRFCDSIDGFENNIGELWLQDEGEEAYRNALVHLADFPNHMYYHIATKVLEHYNSTTVLLSDYEKVPTSSKVQLWRFTELNTGLVGTFYVDNDRWHCEITEDSMTKYLKKMIK